jgi:hypothetical protein
LVIPTFALPHLRRELETEVPVQKSIIGSIKRKYDLDGRKYVKVSESAADIWPAIQKRKAINQQSQLKSCVPTQMKREWFSNLYVPWCLAVVLF